MYNLACKFKVFPLVDPLAGIDKCLRIAKALNYGRKQNSKDFNKNK